ncbi:non-specific serine/threonine protein kinase [Trifolium repens]|nr:non-specific serine/threonine protein kinase [Trifolium repens]
MGVIDDGEGNASLFEITTDTVGLIIYNLTSEGNREEKKWWDEKKKEWKVTWNSMECDIYGVCGIFASCNSHNSPICSCLKEFKPKNKEEWNRENWTEGCVRRTPLQQCERERNQNTTADKKAYGF